MNDNRTGLLLACGVIATPVFFVVAFAQAAMHSDFDLGRHLISQLSTGDLGWIQIANFVVTGILFVAAAFGFRKALAEGPGRVWAPRLIALFGAGLIAAGVFVADPVNGYPVGEVAQTTWHGVLHGVAAVVSGLALVAGLLVFARRFAAAHQTGWAAATIAVAVVYIVLPWVVPSLAGVLLAVASIIGWGWVSVQAYRLRPAVARIGWRTSNPA